MSSNQYLLVEWVEEGNMFPNYDVVNSNSVIGDEIDFYPGKIIFVRTKNKNSAKQAQILRVAENKKLAREHKMLLERQDHQVKNMLSMCMRTIKEIKTEPLMYADQSGHGSSNIVNTVTYSNDDSDSEEENRMNKNIPTCKPAVCTPAHFKNVDMASFNDPCNSSAIKQRQQCAVISTPLPASNIKKASKLTFDQATQTDNEAQIPKDKLEQMEVILNLLYKQFLTLVSRLQLNCSEPANEEQNNTTVEVNANSPENVDERQPETQNLNITQAENLRRNAKLEVRRVSAQTTNNVEPLPSSTGTVSERNMLVSIGSGHAKVPARLLSEIDWNSYTTATRRLLQAVFPRKVLATHSLSGRPSPAFVGKPVKKCLDQKIVDDIINTVSLQCGVPKRLVRNCITTKCTDEAKLYRNRLQGRINQTTSHEDQENKAPSPARSHVSPNETV